MLCAELLREFLEFYKMDYTLQVFKPECNLQNESPQKKDIAAKVGIRNISETMPLLMQLITTQDKDKIAASPPQTSPQVNSDKSPNLVASPSNFNKIEKPEEKRNIPPAEMTKPNIAKPIEEKPKESKIKARQAKKAGETE